MAEHTHDCPGRCGKRVPNRLFACPSCWGRLPRDLQRPITDTARLPLVKPERLAAVQDARRWYREQEPAADRAVTDDRPAARSWTIPLKGHDAPLLSENHRLHHMERHKRTKQLRGDAWKLAKHHKLPRLQRCRVTLHWQPAVRRRRDSENPTPTLKALCDGLTDAKLVPDDTHDRMAKHIEIHDPEPGQRQGRLWLVVDELEAAR